MRLYLRILSLALGAAAIQPVALAGETQLISVAGQIDTSLDGIDAEGIAVSINGVPAALGLQGNYAAQLAPAPYYQVRFDGESIHTAVQTFGHAELFDETCECLTIPAIGVVARRKGRIELLFAGDAMAGRRYINPIWGERQLVDPADPLPDIEALLEPMRPYVEAADLASVNLEIVLSDKDFGNSPPKSVVFYAPPELAQALSSAGFDHVSLGNNHSYDYLEDGLIATIKAVEDAGLAWSGAGLDETQALRPSRVEIDGQPLSLLGFVGWKGRVEPNQIAEADKGGAAFGNENNIAATVALEAFLARSTIVQYHGSREYSDGPTDVSETRMKLAVDNGAALVASHHPHVAQGLELYGDALIAYSTGNFLFDQYFLETHGSFVLRVWLDHGKFAGAEVIPIRVLDYRPVPAVGSMRDAILDRVTHLSAMRGTRITRNGGHGLILQKRHDTPPMSAEAQACPTGHELFRAGDFENAVFGDAQDRSLKAVNASISYPFTPDGGHSLKLIADRRGEGISLLPSTFFRIVPGHHVTITGKVRSNQEISVGTSSQIRPEGMGRFEALESVPFTSHARTEITQPNQWTDIALSFEIAEPSDLRPFRPRLEFAPLGSSAENGLVVELDDLRISVAHEGHCPPG